MKIPWTDIEKEFLHRMGFPFSVEKDLSDDEFLAIDNAVSDHLSFHGLKGNGNELNGIGILCDKILAKLGTY